ncbi:MAG TPA: LamG-like jellyroll fold domain-containing protein [Nocardioides sp.]|jgi:hypothetical protein|uniref:LamG-like jellyroll fold domain-containing protein n=1 Tax=Nocardioides sp. TaxID=35761 RepID=UPI002E2FE00A|nr:LamG-like jellyroll fold domain-containing protein [Nocardioides sp.]HEX3932929.1 LamG-like jellyroll fold domain-containing protein [Nocardioides sp.]
MRSLRSARICLVGVISAIVTALALASTPTAHADIVGHCYKPDDGLTSNYTTDQPFTITACFDEPTIAADGTSTGDTTVQDELARVIGTAQNGDTIYAAFYRLNMTEIESALKSAATSGVTVKVLLDQSSFVDPGLATAGVQVTRCFNKGTAKKDLPANGSYCLMTAQSGIMHNKFLVVQPSAAHTTEHSIVVQESFNPQDGQEQIGQNLLEVTSSANLTKQYVGYWTDMQQDDPTASSDIDTSDFNQPWSWINWSTWRNLTSFTPKPSGTGDDLADVVNGFNCAQTPGGIVPAIYANAPQFTDRDGLLDALIKARAQGCQVNVAVATCSDERYVEDAQYLGNGLNKVKVIRSVKGTTENVTPSFHDKNILIYADHDYGSTHEVEHVIATSSEDFADGFWGKGDNATIEYKDPNFAASDSLWSGYLGHWNWISSHAAPKSALSGDDQCYNAQVLGTAVNKGGPSAYFRLDEPSGAVMSDSSGYGNNGTYTSVTRGATSLLGHETDKAVSFNGTTSVAMVPHSASMDSTSQSGVIWAKSSAITPFVMDLLDRVDGTASDWSLRLDLGRPELVTYKGTTTTTTSPTFGPSYLDGQPHMFAFTYDGSVTPNRVTLYVDGQSVAAATVAGPLNTVNVGLGIGTSPGGNTQQFSGSLDEAAIYNTALSADDIAQLYESR